MKIDFSTGQLSHADNERAVIPSLSYAKNRTGYRTGPQGFIVTGHTVALGWWRWELRLIVIIERLGMYYG